MQAPPKQVPKTIENMRVADETMVKPQDEEVRVDGIVNAVVGLTQSLHCWKGFTFADI